MWQQEVLAGPGALGSTGSSCLAGREPRMGLCHGRRDTPTASEISPCYPGGPNRALIVVLWGVCRGSALTRALSPSGCTGAALPESLAVGPGLGGMFA